MCGCLGSWANGCSGKRAFREREDELIDQALTTENPWFAGITRERLEAGRADSAGAPRSAAVFFARVVSERRAARGELLPVPVYAAAEESRGRSAEFPLEFLPRKADNYMNSTFANHAVHQRMEAATDNVLEMHADDAAARGLVAGDALEVYNQRGRITLRAKVSGKIGKGVVAARLDWNKLSAGGSGVNALTSERLTDLGGGATFYSTLVEVRKLASNASGENHAA